MLKQKAIKKINELIKTGEDLLNHKEYYDYNSNYNSTGVCILSTNSSGYKVNLSIFEEWQEEIRMMLSSDAKFSTAYNQFNKNQKHKTTAEITETYCAILKSLYKSINDDIIELEIKTSTPIKESISTNDTIFIGHGHSNLWNEVVRMLKDDYKLENINYFEKKSQTGRFIGDALRDFKNETSFAIIVMTAEDETIDNKIRARQNVIHEIGFFQGKLGFEKVAILKQKEVEAFSNIDGLQYIEFSENNIKETFYDLIKMLKRENIIS